MTGPAPLTGPAGAVTEQSPVAPEGGSLLHRGPPPMQDPAYLTEENRTGLRMKEGAISKANTGQELPECKIRAGGQKQHLATTA